MEITMNHWIVGSVNNFSESLCRDILKEFSYEPIEIKLKDNQQIIIKNTTLIPKRIIRKLVSVFFKRNSNVKFFAEDSLYDYYKYYKLRV